jgi:hypothetical protein
MKYIKKYKINCCQQSSDKFKELLTAPPILAFFNIEKPFHLTTGAFKVGIVSVLSQENSICKQSITQAKHSSREKLQYNRKRMSSDQINMQKV